MEYGRQLRAGIGTGVWGVGIVSIRRRMYASIIEVLYTPAYRNSFQALIAPLHLEPESLHALLVLQYSRLAVGFGVRGLGHEHALVALRFLVLADAAGL